MNFVGKTSRFVQSALSMIVLIGVAGPTAAAGIRVIAGQWPETVSGPEGGVSAAKVADFGDTVVLTVLAETVSIIQDGSSLSLAGQVRNDGDETVLLYQLEAAVLDGDGALVAVETGQLFGDTAEPAPVVGGAEALAPGATAAFTVGFFVPEANVDAVLIRASGRAADTGIADFPLEVVTDWDIEEMQYGGVWASCVVRNTGVDALVGFSATVVLTNPDGTVLAIERVYPRGERIGGYLGGIRADQELPVIVYFDADRDRIDQAAWDVRFAGQAYDGGSFSYGVVGVARNGGVNGSVWRSSLTLTNRSGAAAAVNLRYYHGAASADAALELGDGETVQYDDVVRALFGVTGSSTGYVQIASSVPLTLVGRTSNEMPAGGFGQALPVYTRGMTIDLRAGGVLTGLRGGPAFRTNLGFVNMTETDCTCRVELYDDDGAVVLVQSDVEVEATSWRQLNDLVPIGIDAVHALIDPEGCLMWAYASVIDNSSGDPTTVGVDLPTVIDLTPYQFRRPGFIMGSWANLPFPEPPAP